MVLLNALQAACANQTTGISSSQHISHHVHDSHHTCKTLRVRKSGGSIPCSDPPSGGTSSGGTPCNDAGATSCRRGTPIYIPFSGYGDARPKLSHQATGYVYIKSCIFTLVPYCDPKYTFTVNQTSCTNIIVLPHHPHLPPRVPHIDPQPGPPKPVSPRDTPPNYQPPVEPHLLQSCSPVEFAPPVL